MTEDHEVAGSNPAGPISNLYKPCLLFSRMELIEEIDPEGNIIAVHSAHKLKEQMFLHKVALVIPRGHDNTFIICRRAKDKHPYPDTWCCGIGGKVRHLESFADAARRECKEEVGQELEVEQVSSFLYNQDDYKALFSVFTTKEPINTDELQPDPREIQYLKYCSINELDEISASPEASPTFQQAIAGFVASLK